MTNLTDGRLEILHGVIAAQNVLLGLPVNLSALSSAYQAAFGNRDHNRMPIEDVAKAVLKAWADAELNVLCPFWR